MLLPEQGIYPNFTSELTLEELTLSMARSILNYQKSSVTNGNNIDRISITTDEEAETTTVAFEGAEAEWVDGEIVLVSYLTGITFTAGTGTYPYNRANLVDAFFHLILTQSKYELNRDYNSDIEARFVDYTITKGEPTSNVKPVVVSCNLTDYPLVITLANGSSSSKAKPYLNNL
ncbi:MAG: hypothetical protein KA714_10695 [Limnoraphis sp. WC205]|jgi:hypothetical protein|nr:hypothetical protein [Limnoraphis sp. WC205]